VTVASPVPRSLRCMTACSKKPLGFGHKTAHNRELTLSRVLVSHLTSSCCTLSDRLPATVSPQKGFRQLQPG
jgi:hypothetical protein